MFMNPAAAQEDLAHGILLSNKHASDSPASLPSIDLLSGLMSFSPSYPEVLRTYLQNFTGRGVPKSKRVHALSLEIILTPEQASAGGPLSIRIPRLDACPACQGTGQAGFFQCDRCNGQGLIEESRTIELLIPPGLQSDLHIPVNLRPMGIHNLRLNVRLRPSEAAWI